MNPELPLNENEQQPPYEASEAEWAALQEEAGRYLDFIMSKEDTSLSYLHITGNLAVSLKLVDPKRFTAERKASDPNRYSKTVAALDYVKRYFKLLDDFPDFAKSELERGPGSLTDLYEEFSDPKELIDAYEVRLRGERV